MHNIIQIPAEGVKTTQEVIENNLCYVNQQIYCRDHKLPCFAMPGCSHTMPWMKGRDGYGKRESLTEMMIRIYGIEKALEMSASEFITGCPGCGHTWCD